MREDGTQGTSTRASVQERSSRRTSDYSRNDPASDKLARVLGTSSTTTDWETSLLQLGMDSLMAVEVVNWIQAELGIALPVVELMRSPGISSLTKLLLERFTGDGYSVSEFISCYESQRLIQTFSRCRTASERAASCIRWTQPHPLSISRSVLTSAHRSIRVLSAKLFSRSSIVTPGCGPPSWSAMENCCNRFTNGAMSRWSSLMLRSGMKNRSVAGWSIETV